MASISWFCGVHVRPTLCNFTPSQAEKGPTLPSPLTPFSCPSTSLITHSFQVHHFSNPWSFIKLTHVYCKNSSFSIPIISNVSCTNNMLFISVFVLSVLPWKKDVGSIGGNFFYTPQ